MSVAPAEDTLFSMLADAKTVIIAKPIFARLAVYQSREKREVMKCDLSVLDQPLYHHPSRKLSMVVL
jgi:hypothetical protein